MRPEGCQETGRADPRRIIPRNLQISNRFAPLDGLTLSKSETYTQRMHTRRIFLAAVGFVACALAWPIAIGAQAVQRALYVSALNEAGKPVPDLGPTDFIVREDNSAREVLKVEPALDPMQIAVLVDNSQAARDDIAHIRTALPAFVSALTGGEEGVKNEVAIIAIGERPTILTPGTTNRATLQKGIDRIWSLQGSGAYLLDGLVETSKGFKKRGARRPVIISIATEGPELSTLQHDQVIEALRDSGVAYHAITLGRPSSSLSDEARNRNVVLDEGPRTTGGHRTDLLTSMALGPALAQLADELTHQYRVTYAHPQSLIPPERVTVAAAKPGLTVRGTLIKAEQGRP
jgi:von Willebrand factor type A domain-containing protein